MHFQFAFPPVILQQMPEKFRTGRGLTGPLIDFNRQSRQRQILNL